MINKLKHGWFAACVALLTILAVHHVRNDTPVNHFSSDPAIKSSAPSVALDPPKTKAPANPFQQKLDALNQHSQATPHVVLNPNVGQDPFKAFLEKQSEMAHQSPFSK